MVAESQSGPEFAFQMAKDALVGTQKKDFVMKSLALNGRHGVVGPAVL